MRARLFAWPGPSESLTCGLYFSFKMFLSYWVLRLLINLDRAIKVRQRLKEGNINHISRTATVRGTVVAQYM